MDPFWILVASLTICVSCLIIALFHCSVMFLQVEDIGIVDLMGQPVFCYREWFVFHVEINHNVLHTFVFVICMGQICSSFFVCLKLFRFGFRLFLYGFPQEGQRQDGRV